MLNLFVKNVRKNQGKQRNGHRFWEIQRLDSLCKASNNFGNNARNTNKSKQTSQG